jgi:membrane protease YdiL (CAAX protease family)
MDAEHAPQPDYRHAACFVALTFLINFALAGWYAFSGMPARGPQFILMAVLYMFGPALAAVIVQKFVKHQPLVGPLGISFRLNPWFIVAILLPAALSCAAFGLALLIPGVGFAPRLEGFFDELARHVSPQRLAEVKKQMSALPLHPFWLSLIQALLLGPTLNAVAASGEELGWRGFLQREFAGLGFWKSSGLIGLIWGAWHAPLVLLGHNYPQHPYTGVGMMIAFTTLLSPLVSYVRLRARSVVAAAVFHGTLNATAGLAVILTQGGEDRTVGTTGAAGLGALALANGLLWVYERRFTHAPLSVEECLAAPPEA